LTRRKNECQYPHSQGQTCQWGSIFANHRRVVGSWIPRAPSLSELAGVIRIQHLPADSTQAMHHGQREYGRKPGECAPIIKRSDVADAYLHYLSSCKPTSATWYSNVITCFMLNACIIVVSQNAHCGTFTVILRDKHSRLLCRPETERCFVDCLCPTTHSCSESRCNHPPLTFCRVTNRGSVN
jgi:hypothetical protein